MKAQTYFANIKRAITGTIVGGSNAMDVNVVQTTAPTSSLSVLETRYHDTNSVNINDNGGAFVEVAVAAAIANSISKLSISCSFGQPITIRKAANAGAAAAAADLVILNKGQTLEVPVILVATDRIWVRSLSSTGVTSGLLTVNLIG